MDTDKMTADLLHDEGEVLSAYTDSLGYLTIGVGHLIDARKGGKISQAASRFILAEDIDAKFRQCREAWSWFLMLGDVRQRAICNMVFQLGLNGVKNFRRMIAAIERQDWTEAAREGLDSAWAKQTPKRALRVMRMLETGRDD